MGHDKVHAVHVPEVRADRRPDTMTTQHDVERIPYDPEYAEVLGDAYYRIGATSCLAPGAIVYYRPAAGPTLGAHVDVYVHNAQSSARVVTYYMQPMGRTRRGSIVRFAAYRAGAAMGHRMGKSCYAIGGAR